MTRVLYLTHDLDDPATWRRVSMLETGGAEVEVAGFRRLTTALERGAHVLGHTYNGRFAQRALNVVRLLVRRDVVRQAGNPDVILARNLEMLPLARRLQAQAPLQARPAIFYEVLDVHRLLVGPGVAAWTLRLIERLLCRSVDRVLISSMRFDEEHFRRYRQIASSPILIENKVWNAASPVATQPGAPVRSTGQGTITIGWFGILRCAASMHCLDQMCRRANGRVRLVLRGRPALDSIPGFHRIVENNPYIEFKGAYTYPGDLQQIYDEVDIAWLIDRLDAGANSDWLLPNRLYEACAHGAIPLGLEGTETARYLARNDLGLVLPELCPLGLGALLTEVSETVLLALREQVAKRDPATWRMTRRDCIELVDLLAGVTGRRRDEVVEASLAPAEIVGK